MKEKENFFFFEEARRKKTKREGRVSLTKKLGPPYKHIFMI